MLFWITHTCLNAAKEWICSFYVDFVPLALIAIVQIAIFALSCRYRSREEVNIKYISFLTQWFVKHYFYLNHIKKSFPLIDILFWFYIHFFLKLTYHSTMTLFTTDRFLVFHLNVRYLVIWTPERLLKSLAVIWLIQFFIYMYFHCLLDRWIGIIFPMSFSAYNLFGMSYILWKLLPHTVEFCR